MHNLCNCPNCQTNDCPAAAELEALTKEVEEATRSAKAWEETAALHCRNEVFYHDLIVKIGESFGVEAKTSDDGSIQQDVLALKVPELVEQLRTQNRELREALTKQLENWKELPANPMYAKKWAIEEITKALAQTEVKP